MISNTNDEGDLYKTKERDDTQQTKYIIQPEKEENDNQKLILQPVIENGGNKLKDKVETHYGGKERLSNLTALKLFV